MRSRHVFALATILIAGFALTLFSFSGPIAQGIAASIKSPSQDVSQTREPTQLPIQKIHDMSVVFSRDD